MEIDDNNINVDDSKPVKKVQVRSGKIKIENYMHQYMLWKGDAEAFLDFLPEEPLFDLVITSPPYNIGKPYEKPIQFEEYKTWQARVIEKIVSRLKPTGSICWQVGNYILNNGCRGTRNSIYPLDYAFYPIFDKLGLQLRNRIIWRYGHGLHCKNRFSGRYEVVLWYTKSDKYTFNLDPVRIPSKYPSKRYFKGPNIGKYSSNPKGKNPEDVWDIDFENDCVWEIPNVKSNHIEKTIHPCQFPVGLAQKLILALSNSKELIFDPYSGVASSGVAAASYNRYFWGCEKVPEYISEGEKRINKTLSGEVNYRPYDKPIYDYTKSNLSRKPQEYDLK